MKFKEWAYILLVNEPKYREISLKWKVIRQYLKEYPPNFNCTTGSDEWWETLFKYTSKLDRDLRILKEYNGWNREEALWAAGRHAKLRIAEKYEKI